MDKEIESIVLKSLYPDLKGILNGGPFMVDLYSLMKLVNYVGDDPIMVSSVFLQYQTSFKIMEAALQSSVEKLYNIRREYFDKYTELYSRSDPSNPFFQRKKITDQTVKSAVGSMPQYIEITRELVDHQMGVLKVRAIRESIDSAVYLVRTLISKGGTVTGTVLKQTELTVQMEALREHIEKLVPSDFIKYYLDSNIADDPVSDL